MSGLYEKYKNLYKKQQDVENKKHRLNRWVVSYADFTTVLLAIFMVLWISSNLKIENHQVLAKNKIQKEIKNKETQSTGPNHLLDGVKNPSDSKEIKVLEFEKTVQNINANLEGKNKAQIIPEDTKITIRLSDGVLFDEGSAIIKADSKKTLDAVVFELKKNNKNITVEGHSDNVPVVGGKYSSNWELSSVRATNIANYLISSGIDKNRLSVAGYADNKPAATNSTEEGRAKNRRVDIVIEN